MAESTRKTSITVKVSPSLRAIIEGKAQAEDRTLSAYLERLLRGIFQPCGQDKQDKQEE